MALYFWKYCFEEACLLSYTASKAQHGYKVVQFKKKTNKKNTTEFLSHIASLAVLWGT